MLLKKFELLSALSIRLTVITRKSKVPLHPKHLIKSDIWFRKHLKKSDKILDLGCNSGQLSLKISKNASQIVGIDLDSRLIEIARSQAESKNISNVKFFSGDLNNKLRYKNNIFDKVICSDVLEHLTKRDFAISEIRRVLKPKGLLLLVTDNPDTAWKRVQKSFGLFYYADPEHKHEYPKKEILSKLKSKKFRIISISTVTYDTPLKGLIDLAGGISLSLYKNLGKWRKYMVKKYPEDTTGFKIVAQRM